MGTYAHASTDELDTREDPDLGRRAYLLREALDPTEMRPRVWAYEEGGRSNRHYQREQEELYHVLDGRFELTVDDDTLVLEAGDFVVVSPDATRQLTALTDGRLFVVGAPNVAGDGVPVEDGE